MYLCVHFQRYLFANVEDIDTKRERFFAPFFEKILSDKTHAMECQLCKKQRSKSSFRLHCISETLHAQEHRRLSQSGVVFSIYHYEYYS